VLIDVLLDLSWLRPAVGLLDKRLAEAAEQPVEALVELIAPLEWSLLEDRPWLCIFFLVDLLIFLKFEQRRSVELTSL